MKNINPSEGWSTPYLVSEPNDFIRLKSEERLLALAMTIPKYGHQQLESTTQLCISATINATQEFLSQIVSALTLTNPASTRNLVVSSSGLDAMEWLERTKDSQHGWIPNYPVSGYITHGLLRSPPSFGFGVMEPAISLSVNRSNDESAYFAVQFSVSESEDMQLLSMLLNEAGDLWDEFENVFGVTPFSSIPLPEDVEGKFDIKSCRLYASAFVDHVVAKSHKDSCLETFDLEFSIHDNTPIHEPIIAATALLNSFAHYRHIVQNLSLSSDRKKAFEELNKQLEIKRK